MDHLCSLSLVFVMLSRLFIVALWSPAGKGLTSWLSFVMLYCAFVTFPCGILGQVWYLIVSIIFATFLTLKENADQEVNVSEKTGICTQTILVQT